MNLYYKAVGSSHPTPRYVRSYREVHENPYFLERQMETSLQRSLSVVLGIKTLAQSGEFLKDSC